MVIDGNQTLEADLKAIAQYLDNLSVADDSISITPEFMKKATEFLVLDEILFWTTKYGI